MRGVKAEVNESVAVKDLEEKFLHLIEGYLLSNITTKMKHDCFDLQPDEKLCYRNEEILGRKKKQNEDYDFVC